MKHTLIFMLTILSTRIYAQAVIAGEYTVGRAEPRATPYDCPEHTITSMGFTYCGSGPFVWWRELCGEYTQPAHRWDGHKWVEDPPCCMRYGGRRFIVIDKVIIKPLGVLVEIPRA